MNVFNKSLVILLTVVGVLFWGGVIFVMWLLPAELGAVLRGLAGTLIQGNAIVLQALVTVFGASVILVALLILIGEFADHEPASIRLSQVSGGTAFVPLASVAQRIKGRVEQQAGVSMVRPHVRRVKDALDTVLDVRVVPEANLSQVAEESCGRVREVVEGQLGVKLKDVRVNISHDPRARPSGDARPRPVQAEERREGEILVPSAAGREPEPTPDRAGDAPPVLPPERS